MKRSRREFLKVSSTGLAAGIAGCSDSQSSESQPTNTSSGSGSTKQELRAQIEELEATIAAKNARIEELEQDGSTTSPAQEFSNDVFEQAETMARNARNGIVTVRGENGSTGTGWVLDSDRGHIVTNSHVVVDSASFSIETFDGETESATRIGYHEDMIPDVALLETNLDGLHELSIGDESTLSNGDPLLTIGHPGNVGNWIMSIGRHESYERGIGWLLSTVPTSSGNSGGPLLTVNGDVVGVVSGGTSMGENRDRYSKSDKLYTELPSSRDLTTSAPVATLMESINEWV
ncbi:serine protease [Halorubrum sp. Ib24]|uniref:trypsin-like peptidase domain-containing protein n=1 Tax=Halorubrum sp. Ib24 TaxID=1383850 RepID=UPI000B982B8E|nr:trypsin-like peptidase domain-containing protein [Halorubrum sp. Ib24]OYR38426.1 serine protease [Halorubrum sp. Ib24]